MADSDWVVVLLDLTLEAASGVRVGGPRGDNLGTDAPVLRDARGPVLPGSSFKGVLRSAAERLLRTMPVEERRGDAEGPPSACDILVDPCGGMLAAADGEAQPVDLDRLCRVCRLFGSPHFGGRLTVSDLVVVGGGNGEAAVTVIRDGVAIDRDELKASDRLKFDYEVVVPGTRFAGRLRVDDPERGDLGLLATLLDLLDLGVITVGGGASRGLGWLRLATPLAARRLRASTWVIGGTPEEVDLAAERQELRDALVGGGARRP